MKNLLSSAENQDIIFVNNVKELKNNKGLINKRLCIIKTDFKDIDKIKKFCKSFPKLEIWLATRNMSRHNILTANSCGVKNVIEYPIKKEVLKDLLKDNSQKNFGRNSEKDEKKFACLNGQKVMIVDDNPFNIELLEETLKTLNLNLTSCQKPKDAAKIVDNEKFDLFLLDIMMPELSGFELAEKIQSTKLNSETPIVFISALSDAENKVKSFDLGSYAYIEKPFNIKVVKSQICNLLKTTCERENHTKQQDSYWAMVTHDMKGPVQAELSALNILLKNNEGNFNEWQIEILNDMVSSAKYLQTLIANVLQKFKCDNGTVVITKQPNSFKKLITECCDELQYIASERDIIIKAFYDSGIDEFLFDYDEIKRVLHNLLTNALKYSYKHREILITVKDDKNNIIVSIKNYGMGIDLENPDDVFDKFTSYCEKYKSISTGLGLYIAKEIVSAHGGGIHFKSSLNDKTIVTFNLPVKA